MLKRTLMTTILAFGLTPAWAFDETPSCLAALPDGVCALSLPHRVVEFRIQTGVEYDEVMAGMDGAELSIDRDIVACAETGEMTLDEARLIANETLALDGVRYEVPELAQLKNDLGFPAEIDLNAEDLRDLVRAHLQISLGVSPVTASYLADRMGIERVIPADDSLDVQAKVELESNDQ